MLKVLEIANQIIFYLLEFFFLANAFLFIIGLIPKKRKYPILDDKEKFCIFVPCHNEGDVIAATVKNYTQIDYDKNLYDIYFIADNCSDNTAEILRQTILECKKDNFYVLERNTTDPLTKGKPHALKWSIDLLEKENKFYNFYDLFMIFDADNFVDSDILRHVNSQYLSCKRNKPVMIQCYLDSKNKNSVIARSYYTGYRISNRTAQAARSTLRLVPAIGGTGFAMTTAFLKEIGGYNCKTLTEDLEIQTIATLKCKSILYNGFARVYDEKPTGFKQATVQRTRWAQGHWFICFKYSWRLLLSLFDLRKIKYVFKKIDMLFYLHTMFFVVLSAVFLLLQIPVIILKIPFDIPTYLYILNLVLSIFSVFLLIPITTLYDGSRQDKRSLLKDYIPNVISLLVLSVVQIIASTVGLIKCGNQRVWKKTHHEVTTMDRETKKMNGKTPNTPCNDAPTSKSNAVPAIYETEERRDIAT